MTTCSPPLGSGVVASPVWTRTCRTHRASTVISEPGGLPDDWAVGLGLLFTGFFLRRPLLMPGR